MTDKKTATIIGAAGYVGAELLTLLQNHPQVEVTQITSERLAGRFVHTVHPNLRGHSNLRFMARADIEPTDILFIGLPHGSVASDIADYDGLARDLIVDASADFRLRDPAAHGRWYEEETANPEWRSKFVYGLPEVERENLKGARYISGVGCNATTVNLGLLPLARAGLIDHVVADVKVGSSEGGAKESSASHHPERSGAVRSFAPTRHRHQAEICQELGLEEDQLFMSATAIDMVRGVLATCHVFLNQDMDEKSIRKLYRDAYADEPFVRIVMERQGIYRLPEPKVVAGTNYCDVGWQLDNHGRRLVVISALDNLVKGAAGSAIQSMNIALGFEEKAGLEFMGLRMI